MLSLLAHDDDESESESVSLSLVNAHLLHVRGHRSLINFLLLICVPSNFQTLSYNLIFDHNIYNLIDIRGMKIKKPKYIALRLHF